MFCGTAGFLQIPFNYPWVVFIARINLLRTTPETAGWIWSQQAGVRGGRGSQEGEAGDDTARTGKRVQGGVWSQLRALEQRTVSQCGMLAAPGSRAGMTLSAGIRRDSAGTRRCLCSALPSLASPFLFSPSLFLLRILSEVLHSDPSVELLCSQCTFNGDQNLRRLVVYWVPADGKGLWKSHHIGSFLSPMVPTDIPPSLTPAVVSCLYCSLML